jgi:hypothetical protein
VDILKIIGVDQTPMLEIFLYFYLILSGIFKIKFLIGLSQDQLSIDSILHRVVSILNHVFHHLDHYQLRLQDFQSFTPVSDCHPQSPTQILVF